MRCEICKKCLFKQPKSIQRSRLLNYAAMSKQLPSGTEAGSQKTVQGSRRMKTAQTPPPSHCQCRLKLFHTHTNAKV